MYEEQRLNTPKSKSNRSQTYLTFRMWFLLLFWTIIAIVAIITEAQEQETVMIVLMPMKAILKKINFPNEAIEITLDGPIDTRLTSLKHNQKEDSFVIRVEWRDSKLKRIFVRSASWRVYRSKNRSEYTKIKKVFKVSAADVPFGYPENEPISVEEWGYAQAVISMTSESKSPVGIKMTIHYAPVKVEDGVVYSLVLLVILYAMLITEHVDRYFGSVFICCGALTLLSCLGRKPSFETVSRWVNFGTLMILLGSMIMVALLSDTGFFDYITLLAYRASKGHSWLLIYILCMASAFLSAILDNATVILLLAPASIRLCEAAFINTKVVLIILAIYSNLGGSMTPVGVPANIIITTNNVVASKKVNFFYFIGHMFPASVLSMLMVFGLIFVFVGHRIYEVDEHQLARWRALKKPTPEIRSRIQELRRKMEARRWSWFKPVHNYFDILATVEANQPIMNVILSVHIGVAFLFTFTCIVLRSMPSAIPNSAFGWVSMLAAFLLLILGNKTDISPFLTKMSWGILIYLTSIFIITEVIVELGLIFWMGRVTMGAVMDDDVHQQNISTMLIILWTSAFLSAFIDNAAVATILLKLCIELANRRDADMLLMKLVWALLLGTNYGGNGTMLGSLSNEFVALVAEEHGYTMTFMEFFYVGFPITIVTVGFSSVYLLVANSILTDALPWTHS